MYSDYHEMFKIESGSPQASLEGLTALPISLIVRSFLPLEIAAVFLIPGPAPRSSGDATKHDTYGISLEKEIPALP